MSVNKKRINDEISERGRFTQIPNELWEFDIDHMAKVIWAYIYSRHPEWSSSRNNLARNLGMSRDTVTAHLKTLEDCNMLVKTVGERGAWDFEVLGPSKWTSSPVPSAKPQTTRQEVEDEALDDLSGLIPRIAPRKAEKWIETPPVFVAPLKGTGSPVQNQPQVIPVVPAPVLEERPQYTFSDILNLWLKDGDLFARLKGAARFDSLETLLTECKQAGLQRSDVNLNVFKKKVLANAFFLTKNTRWQDEIWDAFDQAISIAFTKPVPKTPKSPAQSTVMPNGWSREEYDLQQEYKKGFAQVTEEELAALMAKQSEPVDCSVDLDPDAFYSNLYDDHSKENK